LGARKSDIVEVEVRKALSLIKATTAPGHEQFPGFVLKKRAEALATNITAIYNSTFIHNSVPTSWKMADIRAIYKQKGNKSDPSNYRPISVLPILGRTLEKLAAAQLYNYCELNAIIPPQQFGFRRHSSCEMALLLATICGWMPLIKDLTSGHSWLTYRKHSIQFHTYSYFLNL